MLLLFPVLFVLLPADVAVLGQFPWFQEFALLKWKDISGWLNARVIATRVYHAKYKVF